MGGLLPILWGPEIEKPFLKVGEVRICFLSVLLWAGTFIFSCPQCTWFSGLHTWTGIYTISSPVLRPLNYTTRLPGSPACRQKVGEPLSLHDHVSQYLSVNIYMCRHINVSSGFCFCGESWLIQGANKIPAVLPNTIRPAVKPTPGRSTAFPPLNGDNEEMLLGRNREMIRALNLSDRSEGVGLHSDWAKNPKPRGNTLRMVYTPQLGMVSPSESI